MKRNIFKLFLNKFLAYPLWIKQVVYYRLYQNMSENYCEKFIIKNADKIFALNIPTLTFNGKNELLDKSGGLDSNIYNFLKYIHDGYNILEISLNMFMSIEEISKLYMFCLEQSFIAAPENSETYAMAGFIAGKFRTGEYFLKNGSIAQDQLDVALAAQRQQVDRGNKELLGKTLVRLGFITEEAIKTLFRLKADSRKRFVINPDMLPDDNVSKDDPGKLQEQIKALKDENQALKKAMTEIINTVKNYDI